MSKVLLIVALIFALSVNGATYNCSPACSSNGVCIAGNACQCNPGWAGRTCTVPICTTPCQNGKCIQPDTCECSYGYTGQYCQTFTCDDAGCIHGKCISAAYCKCEAGYANVSCNQALCDGDWGEGCANGGVCYLPGKCDCSTTAGWSGPWCKDPICNATTGLCVHGGVCVGAGSCNCNATGLPGANTPGWTGRLCEVDVNECLLKNFTACDKKTKCTNLKGTYSCSACPAGYSGDGKTGCVPSCPYGCSNGGICSSPGTCNCTGTGYTGNQCFQDLDECSTPGYCDPLATTCINLIGSFQCTGCPGNYTGDPIMAKGGCQPICDRACPTGSKCTAPNVCSDAFTTSFNILLILLSILLLIK